MPRAIDFHVHLPIAEFMNLAPSGNIALPSEQYFHKRGHAPRHRRDCRLLRTRKTSWGCLLAWDAETATGQEAASQRHCGRDRPPLPAAIRRLRQR